MKYLTPLKIFVIGQILLIVTFPFFPAIGQVSDTLTSTPESVAAETWAWGWSWMATQGMVKWLVYLVLEGGVWLATFLSFWKMKNSNN